MDNIYLLLTGVILMLALAGFVMMAFVFLWVPYKDSKGEYLVIHRKPSVSPNTNLKGCIDTTEKPDILFEWKAPPD